MARKAGQLISRGPRTWLVRISLGRDPETGTMKYHNRTVHGSFREAQTYLNAKLQEREVGHPSMSWRPAARRNYSVRHSEPLRSDVQP
jgi:hypothetical protein